MSLCRSSAATLLAAVIPGCLSSQAARDTSGAPPRNTAGVAPLTSETVIRGDFLRALPVDDSRQALILAPAVVRSEEHTSELQSPYDLVCRLLLEKKNVGDRPLSPSPTRDHIALLQP